MKRRTPIFISLIAVAVVALTIGGFVIYRQTEAGQIAYHLRRFELAGNIAGKPSSLKEFFTEEGLAYLSARVGRLFFQTRWKTSREQWAAWNSELQALVDLGYFVRCEFLYTGENDFKPDVEFQQTFCPDMDISSYRRSRIWGWAWDPEIVTNISEIGSPTIIWVLLTESEADRSEALAENLEEWKFIRLPHDVDFGEVGPR